MTPAFITHTASYVSHQKGGGGLQNSKLVFYICNESSLKGCPGNDHYKKTHSLFNTNVKESEVGEGRQVAYLFIMDGRLRGLETLFSFPEAPG